MIVLIGLIAVSVNELRARTNELAQSVGELQALGEVSQAVNSTLDLERVLSTIVAKAVQLSGTEAGAIYVFDDRQRELHLKPNARPQKCGAVLGRLESLARNDYSGQAQGNRRIHERRNTIFEPPRV
jgi:GAF domain-containing protein